MSKFDIIAVQRCVFLGMAVREQLLNFAACHCERACKAIVSAYDLIKDSVIVESDPGNGYLARVTTLGFRICAFVQPNMFIVLAISSAGPNVPNNYIEPGILIHRSKGGLRPVVLADDASLPKAILQFEYSNAEFVSYDEAEFEYLIRIFDADETSVFIEVHCNASANFTRLTSEEIHEDSSKLLKCIFDAPGRIGPVIALELPYDVPDDNRAQRRAYRHALRDALAPEMLDQLGKIDFLPGDATKEDLWERLAVRLAEIGAKDVILFLAIPPYLVNPVLKRLQAALPPDLRVRILLDKPWGPMPKLTECSWREQIQPALTLQALFLDHYLGKAPVRALAEILDRHSALRPALAGRHLTSLEVAIAEAAPVGPRPHYAETGAMADMGNHLLNLAALALVGLSGADRSDAEIDALRASSLAALCRAQPDTVCLGQYDGFSDELGVDAATRTETCFDVEMAVDLTGLAGSMLPHRLIVRLRSGKALEARTAHVVATYSDGTCLTVTIQPKPRVQLSAPDGGVVLDQPLNTAGLPQGAPYGVLIRELIDGQNRWLVPYDGVTAVNGWTSALCYSSQMLPVHRYAPGSRGPDTGSRPAAE